MDDYTKQQLALLVTKDGSYRMKECTVIKAEVVILYEAPPFFWECRTKEWNTMFPKGAEQMDKN